MDSYQGRCMSNAVPSTVAADAERKETYTSLVLSFCKDFTFVFSRGKMQNCSFLHQPYQHMINTLCIPDHVKTAISLIITALRSCQWINCIRVFLCQTPQMPPSRAIQETGLWVWRMLSSCAVLQGSPNPRTSPGHGTTFSLFSNYTYLLSYHQRGSNNTIKTDKCLFKWHRSIS